ncbi:MAG: heterodisulfide reductase [Deltaproteobacteria bacterium]|nr:heterodisulfide reductase [Deltaproteobacteria bacterium]
MSALTLQPASAPAAIAAAGPRPSFLEEVRERSGTEFSLCYQCQACANGCPFVSAMDYRPNQVLRLVQFGMREEVLQCKTIWVCVGCHTCSSQCPMAIDLAALMDTLRLLAVEQGVPVGKPNIIDFHEEVLRSLEKYGRAHKLGIMLGYKRQTGGWLQDLDVGLKMLAKRKLELFPSRVKAGGEIADLFRCYWRESR